MKSRGTLLLVGYVDYNPELKQGNDIVLGPLFTGEETKNEEKTLWKQPSILQYALAKYGVSLLYTLSETTEFAGITYGM